MTQEAADKVTSAGKQPDLSSQGKRTLREIFSAALVLRRGNQSEKMSTKVAVQPGEWKRLGTRPSARFSPLKLRPGEVYNVSVRMRVGEIKGETASFIA